ncbi:MAG: Sugar ABC transporter substrate-binding protein [Clostridium sp.]|jgi:arabinogalactan oligomer / maltooligosaccharide transport system substrate-binding protein
MKSWHKCVCVALAASMVVGTTACSNSSVSSEDSGDGITLRILENDTAKSEGYLDELLDAFNEAYKDQGIQAVDANLDEYSDLAENGPYGYGPDVLYQANDKLMTYAEDKHLLAIQPQDYECYEYTPDEAWDAFEINVDGKTYTCGVPVNVQEPMLFYRADMMPENWKIEWDDNRNGVADFFENWNDLYAYSSYLREHDTGASQDTQYGFMSSLNNLYLNANFFFSYGAYVFGENADGSVDSTDIGFAAGNAAKGMNALIQFAGLMNEGCIDDTIITNRYEKLANGNYFCCVSTPDTYSTFVEKLALEYESEGLSSTEAESKAEENIQMIELPAFMPADGDLSRDSSEMSDSDWVPTVVMGGINGYGISAYTKHKEACIEFVNFATGYEMITKRCEMLGIAPTRSDVAEERGSVANTIFDNLESGRIELMPSVKAVDQIWTPVQTMMEDMAKDAYRADSEKKYTTQESIQQALEKVDKDIYDAIYTLGEQKAQ